MNDYEILKQTLCGYRRIAVAYSGGVDSSLLLRAACDALGRENVLAVTVFGPLHTGHEAAKARDGAARLGVSHIVQEFDPLSIPEVESNLPLRCYYCKKAIFTEIFRIAKTHGFSIVCDGTNASDSGAYRPGVKALSELGARSPLRACGITKEDARRLLRALGMEEASRPSNSCLATRVPYHVRLTPALLSNIAQAEELLHRAGFPVCRVRVQDELARIEIPKEDFSRFLAMPELHDAVKALGFSFITLDLEGYRSGCYDTREVRGD